jgi:hypothetical protein
MTDVSTKGLLPQLTDVLHALADSHALLLSKIQSVRLEHISADYSEVEMIEESSGAALGDEVDLVSPTLVDQKTSPKLEVPGAIPIDEVESSRSSNRIASSEFETSPSRAVAATDQADQVATSPSPASAEMVTPHGDLVATVSTQTPSLPDGSEAQHVDPAGAGSENRNYNFFDELDARLAGLGDAESAGDR